MYFILLNVIYWCDKRHFLLSPFYLVNHSPKCSILSYSCSLISIIYWLNYLLGALHQQDLQNNNRLSEILERDNNSTVGLSELMTVAASGASVWIIRLNWLALGDGDKHKFHFMAAVQRITTDNDLINEQTQDDQEHLTPKSEWPLVTVHLERPIL